MDVLGVHEVLRYMNRIPGYSGIDTFVETGTGKCGTVFQMCAIFDRVLTIEASPKLFGLMSKAYAATKVEFRLGESHVVLDELFQEIGRDHPMILYLDAHWYKSGSGDAIYSKAPAPVLQELEVIYDRPYADLIIVDDSRLFGQQKSNLDWRHITVESVLSAIGEDTVQDSYEENDRYLIFRKEGKREPRDRVVEETPQAQEVPKPVKVGQFF